MLLSIGHGSMCYQLLTRIVEITITVGVNIYKIIQSDWIIGVSRDLSTFIIL